MTRPPFWITGLFNLGWLASLERMFCHLRRRHKQEKSSMHRWNWLRRFGRRGQNMWRKGYYIPIPIPLVCQHLIVARLPFRCVNFGGNGKHGANVPELAESEPWPDRDHVPMAKLGIEAALERTEKKNYVTRRLVVWCTVGLFRATSLQCQLVAQLVKELTAKLL